MDIFKNPTINFRKAFTVKNQSLTAFFSQRLHKKLHVIKNLKKKTQCSKNNGILRMHHGEKTKDKNDQKFKKKTVQC